MAGINCTQVLPKPVIIVVRVLLGNILIVNDLNEDLMRDWRDFDSISLPPESLLLVRKSEQCVVNLFRRVTEETALLGRVVGLDARRVRDYYDQAIDRPIGPCMSRYKRSSIILA